MPLLRSGTDRAVLRVGNNTLGGRGADALPVAALEQPDAINRFKTDSGYAVDMTVATDNDQLGTRG